MPVIEPYVTYYGWWMFFVGYFCHMFTSWLLRRKTRWLDEFYEEDGGL